MNELSYNVRVYMNNDIIGIDNVISYSQEDKIFYCSTKQGQKHHFSMNDTSHIHIIPEFVKQG